MVPAKLWGTMKVVNARDRQGCHSRLDSRSGTSLDVTTFFGRTMGRCLLALILIFCAARATPAAADITYRTEIQGVEDRQLARDLRDASQLVQQQNRPPASEVALRRRAEADRERLDTVLRAAGYYDATIAFDIDLADERAVVRVNIDPGPRYTLASVSFVAPDGKKPPLIDRYAPLAFGLKLGEPALSRPVLDAEQRIVRTLAEHGFPLAKVTSRRAVVDRATKTMDVTYTVDAGPAAAFGPVTITGTHEVDADYIRRRIAWGDANAFDIRFIEQTRKELVASGLFSTIQIRPADSVGPDGRIPITIEVTERPPRSIAVGLNYDTSLGVSGRTYWEHRNVFGDAERLRVTGELGEKRQGVQGNFRRPDIAAVNQDFVSTALVERELFDAYNRRRALVSAGMEQRFDTMWIVGASLQAERTHIEQPDRTFDYTLFGLPLLLRHDNTDDPLDPTEGSRQIFSTTPYYGPDLGFLTSRLQGTAYHAFDDAKNYVIAGYATIGSTIGESLNSLPKDKRFYAGGGGSVRGYGFQKAGPLDSNGDPIGGRSLLELGVELRVKVTETIGIVPFVEGGNVYDTTLPDFGERLFFGAGLGLRYFTPIGPIRLDVAFPLDKRPEDKAFQVYISIGQAF
jgi:translocation and assembly module TamA